LADKSSQLVLDALSRAVSEPAGLALFGSKSNPGLFNSTSPARQAAQQCKTDGYLQVIATQTKGKNALEICAITEKGLSYLLDQLSPKHVLEDLVRAVQARAGQLADLVATAQRTEAGLQSLEAMTQTVLQQLGKPQITAQAGQSANGSEVCKSTAMRYLTQWESARPAEDCPLPELYRHMAEASPSLSIGCFHDGLRQLYGQQKIYLHPWTGPLYDLPEPPYALLVGHEVAYYASLRK